VPEGLDEVTLVRWPDEDARRASLREAGRARLLLVDHGLPAPEVLDPLEDWIRVPADEADMHARLTMLARRVSAVLDPRPTLVDGVLRLGDRWVALAPVEARLVAVLLDRYGAVVDRSLLTRAGWSGGAPSRNALDVKIFRVRRRIATLGLTIRTVRSRGYLLEAAGPTDC
jgi:DNA-binding response OmpR family regulator